jgi:hypothetical protein
MFTQAELERANRSMHARFLTVSEQIFHELSRLERHIEGAPLNVRTSVLAAAALIASTQQRLRAQTHHLPSSPLRRFQILRSSLDAQQSALRHLSIIVKQHAPLHWRQATPVTSLVRPPLKTQEPYRALAVPPNRALSPDERVHRAQADAVMLARHFCAGATASADHGWPNNRSDRHNVPARNRAAHTSRDGSPDGGKSAGARLLLAIARKQTYAAIDRAGSRSLALVAILVTSAILSYGMFPRASEQRDEAATPIEVATPSIGPGAAASGAPSVGSDAGARSDAPPAPSLAPLARPQIGEKTPMDTSSSPPSVPAERAPSPWHPDVAGVADRPGPRVLAPTEPALLSAAKSTMPPASAAAGPGAKSAPSKQKQAAPKLDTEPAVPIANAGKERFVPVVFTHKNDATAMRAFGDLQQQYPKLLDHRQGEAQPVDLGKKGIWHRLVVLPPGSRPQAMKLCDQLLAAGYDRCWVTAY